MRTKSYNVYKFDELSEEAKNQAIFDQITFEIETMTDDSPYHPQGNRSPGVVVGLVNLLRPPFCRVWSGGLN